MTESITELDIDGIKARIPHRAPMLLIDKVRDIQIDKKCRWHQSRQQWRAFL